VVAPLYATEDGHAVGRPRASASSDPGGKGRSINLLFRSDNCAVQVPIRVSESPHLQDECISEVSGIFFDLKQRFGKLNDLAWFDASLPPRGSPRGHGGVLLAESGAVRSGTTCVRIPTIAAIDSDRNQPPVPIEASRGF